MRENKAIPYNFAILYDLIPQTMRARANRAHSKSDREFSLEERSERRGALPASTRAMPPRPAIDRRAVVDAALAVTDREGLHRLTIRAVADEVRVAPMTLYTHFARKEQLHDLMFERVLEKMFESEPRATWERQLEASCRHARATLLAHPHWLALLTRVSVPPLGLRFYDRLLALMNDDGFSTEAAMHAFSSAMSFTIGLVLVERMMSTHQQLPIPKQRLAIVRSILPTLPAADYRAVHAAAPTFDQWSFDNVFDLGLRSLLAGIEDHCGAPRHRKRKRVRWPA
jgi:AcrR family transcriptional regulator